jgi:malonate transporter
VLGVLTGFGLIGFVIFVGYLVGRFNIAGDNAQRVFSRTALFVTNPALLFTVLAQADVREVFSETVAVAAGSALGVAALYVLLSRLFFRRPAAETIVGAMGASYVNANNIGIPVAIYVIGDATLVAPVILLQLIVFTPLCLTILDVASGGKPSVRSILTQPIRNPVIIASLAGLLVAAADITLPEPVLAPLELLGGSAVPLVLMAFGISLNGMRPFTPGSGRVDIAVSAGLKSFLMPLLAYLLARFTFGEPDRDVFGAVVMASLPTAQNVFLFASRYERGVTIARDVVLLSTIAAVPTLLLASALLG